MVANGHVTVTTKLLASALALWVGAPVLAQQDFSAVDITTQRVADGLYMLMGVGGNMAVSIGPDGAVLVDTEFAPLSDKIRAAVRQVGGGDIRFVINTHWHVDHAGGNEPFGKAGAVIIAHENARARLSTEQFMAFFNQTIPPAPAAALPIVTFPTRATFHWNGNTVNVVHVANAHTDGDVVVHFTDANVFHTGDTFVNGEYPFIDLGSNGKIDGLIAAAEGLLARSDVGTKIIPGHGALASRADLQGFTEMLVKIRGNIQALIDQGKSEDEAVTAKPTAEFDARWGGSVIDGESFTRLAYQSLTR